MRKITKQVCGAFMRREKLSVGNSYTAEETLYLHGNAIAKWQDGKLFIRSAGWETTTTKERLNGLPGVHIQQVNFCWILNGKPWKESKEWTEVI
jgi:hypothetical protein